MWWSLGLSITFCLNLPQPKLTYCGWISKWDLLFRDHSDLCTTFHTGTFWSSISKSGVTMLKAILIVFWFNRWSTYLHICICKIRGSIYISIIYINQKYICPSRWLYVAELRDCLFILFPLDCLFILFPLWLDKKKIFDFFCIKSQWK